MVLADALRTHLDRFCGKQPDELKLDEESRLRVVTFRDVPSEGLHSFLTIGLSGHTLIQPNSGTPIRQEILICVDQAWATLPWQEPLAGVARAAAEEHRALMRGEILGPFGRIFPEQEEVSPTAFVCSAPAFFPDGFFELDAGGDSVLFVELIPITDREVERIRGQGAESFLEEVDSGRVDILDLARKG
jgi:hypothetical protein